MTIAIIGGSGFLGKNLTTYLLERTDWQIDVVSHSAKPFTVDEQYTTRVRFVEGDVLDAQSIAAALDGVDIAYYFVHMMGQPGGNFYELELQAATIFSKAIAASHVQRLIYMGGLGVDSDTLSEHLRSRHRTGEIFRKLPTEVIEFRASMVISRGSVAFDIITNLVDRLPVIIMPRSAGTHTQPIALHDALAHLHAAANVPISGNSIVEIGGPDVLSYADIYRRYASFRGLKRLVLRVPFVPARLEAQFLDLFTPKIHARIGQAMIESLGNEMIVSNHTAAELFPAIKPVGIETAFELKNRGRR